MAPEPEPTADPADRPEHGPAVSTQPLGAGRADDEPVTFSFSSSRNIKFRGKGEELGVTWGEWRKMTPSQRDALLNETLWGLVELSVDE